MIGYEYMSIKSPSKIVETLDEIGLSKCHMSLANLMILAVFAGVYVGFGAILATIVSHDLSTYVGSGFAKLISGAVFSVGLMLVLLCGAELFTGNNLLIIPCIDRKVTPQKLLSNWTVVYIGNFLGSLFLVFLIFASGVWKIDSNLVGVNSITIANSKVNLSFLEAFSRGILCNWLVCLSVWVSTSASDTTGKILAIFFPIMAFVTCGFEHSVANMFYIPLGILLKGNEALVAIMDGIDLSNLNWGSFLYHNLLPVTIGNIIGGAIFVGFLYWFVYRKRNKGWDERAEKADTKEKKREENNGCDEC